MNKDKLKKANELQEKIKELESFLLFMNGCEKGKLTVKASKLKYITFSTIERELELNEILLWRMITEVRKELEHLKRSFENL